MCMMAAMAFASTKSFTVTLFEPAMVGTTQLQAGDYKVELQDQRLLLKHGKQTTEATVTVQNNDTKYSSTAVTYAIADGKNKVQEIRIGGTNMKLVLN